MNNTIVIRTNSEYITYKRVSGVYHAKYTGRNNLVYIATFETIDKSDFFNKGEKLIWIVEDNLSDVPGYLKLDNLQTSGKQAGLTLELIDDKPVNNNIRDKYLNYLTKKRT